MRHPGRNVLAFAFPDAGSFLAHSRFLSRPSADLAEPITRSRIDPRSTLLALARRPPGLRGGDFSPRRLLLLAGDGLGRAFAGTGIGMGALTTHRKAAAMPQSTV